MEPATWAAALVALFGPILTWMVARRKVAIDESAEVFKRWKDLTDRMDEQAATHREEMRVLREELRVERHDNALLRERVKELEDEVAGLKRRFLQNSDSTVIALGRKLDQDGTEED